MLIGAAEYVNHPRLYAPAHDVAEMSMALQALGVAAESISYLDGRIGPAATRRAILERLDALADNSVPGELVIIYYSGHGTQVRDTDGDESDQKDEAIVPVDAPARMAASDLVLDDQIKSIVDRLLSNGAHVWTIFDSCHAGTVTRSQTDGVRVKGLGPRANAGSASGASAGSFIDLSSNSKKSAGTLVSFFASHAHESSIEMSVGGEGGEYKSVFTAALVDSLRNDPGVSFRQLIEIVRTMVSATAGRQTPNAEGNGLDRFVPGGSSINIDRGYGWWPLNDGRAVDVGWVRHVEEGSVFTLHKTASLEPSNVKAKVFRSGALRSVLQICEQRDEDTCVRSKPKSPSRDFKFAKLVEPAVSEELSIRVVSSSPEESSAFLRLKSHVEKTDWRVFGLSITYAKNTQDARILLHVEDGIVHLVTGLAFFSEDLAGRYPSLKLSEALDAELLANKLRGLWQINRLTNLAVSLSGNRNKTWISIDAKIEISDLKVEEKEKLLKFRPGNASFSQRDAVSVCATSSARHEPKELNSGSQLTDCDRVSVSISSRSTDSVRLYLMYYGPKGCLVQIPFKNEEASSDPSLLGPASTSATGIVQADVGSFYVLTRDPEPSLGRQGLIVLALRVRNGKDPGYSIINHCESSSLRNQNPVTAIVSDLLARPTLRSGSGKWETDDIAIDHIFWSVEPYSRIRAD